MNVVELSQRLQQLQEENDRLRQVVNTGRNSEALKVNLNAQSYRDNMNPNSQQYRSSVIDFQTKYKKALKEIYEVIQANKSLKEELEKFKTSRSRIDGSMHQMRKEEVYKAYENVLGEKNELNDRLGQIQNENEHYHMEIESLQAQMNVLKQENMQLNQQKQGLQLKLQSGTDGSSKSQQLQELKQRIRQKEHQFHRTIQNYEQHHITLSNQNKRNEQRLSELQQRLIQNDTQWRHRYEAKEIQFKQIKSNVRHQYQQQINMLRKEINSLKVLNTQLMTKLQTIELQGHTDNNMTEYQIQMLNSIKQLRLQMQPLKKQIIQLQQQNYFDKQQLERQKTQLQLKLYEHQSTIQHYSITLKNQQDKIIKLNESLKKHQSNQLTIKKLEEENKILGGRVIVLESKDIALQNRKDNGYKKLQENVLEFQNRVQMLLNQKENLANTKNVTIHQLVTLKAYIAQLDQKLKNASHENDYATKKYKSYKEKYLNTLKQMKNHQLMHNTLKSKIIGYDKLVQRLQSELEKNVNISEMQVIEMTSKTTQEQVQLQTFKKKYQSLKQKLILQQKYNKQQLETIKLNYETKIVDLTIKVEEINSLRQAIQLYKEKNEQLQNLLSRKDNEILEIRLSQSKSFPSKTQNEPISANQNRDFILSLQQTIRKQQGHITKIQSQLRIQQDSSRKRILTLERELHETQGEFNKAKMSTSSTRYSTDKSSEQVLTENKRLRNRVSQLQNEIILTKGRVTEESSKNTYELQFKASSLEIEKNELTNRLETQLSNRKRVEKQMNDLMMRNNELQAEMTQLTIQNNRKVQQITYELNQKLGVIENLQEEIRRVKSQQRKASVEILPMVNTSIAPFRQDHSLCENKISRLERQLESTRLDNEELRRRISQSIQPTGTVAFSYQIESLKHQKQQYRLKIQRLQKEIASSKSTINSLQEQKYQSTRIINNLKQQISSLKLSHEDDLFDKQRLITQYKTKLQHNQIAQQNYLQMQNQLEYKLNQKDRQIAQLKAKLNNAQNDMQRMNDAINKYTREISNIKYNSQSQHQLYTEQMESLLEEKTKTLQKYQLQINNLHQQIQQLSTQLSAKTQSLIKTQTELNQLQLLQDQINRVTSSLSDRENIISKNRYELSIYEEENQRLKRELSTIKEQLQRQRLQMLQKQDEVSSLRLELSNLSTRLSNQIRSEFIDQLGEKDHQLTRLNFQLQSVQNSFNSIQQELNETQSRERKAQQQLAYVKSQLSRTQEDMNELSQRLMRKQTQINQVTNQISGLKYLQEEITQKNGVINKLRSQLSSIRIQMSQLTEQVEYKESTIIRQGNDLRGAREQILNRQETIGMKQSEIRNLIMEIQRLKSTLDDNEMVMQQKQNTINKLTAQLSKAKQQQKDYEEEIQQREQQWSNIQYELNQAKSQINLVSDQLEAKDILIVKLSNQTAFMKQQITRLNEEVINKNHEINRVSQQVFVQKMEYTNKTSEQVQTLSNELYSIKRQLQSTRHTVEDLEGENRRLKIQLQGSRVKLIEQSTPLYIYTEEDLALLREDNNNKYREIMQLQLQLNQRNSEISLLHEKSEKLQLLLHQLQEENHYNKQYLQEQIQQFIEHERQLRTKIEFLQSNSSTTQEITVSSGQEHNTEELKFGLKLYTQETDRLKKIIDQLTEEVTALRLKLTAYTNQQDRINQNLVTMVMTFAEVQALRDRMKTKQEEINSVRRSFIQAISSSEDLNSQYKFQSTNIITNQNKEQKIQTFDVLSQNSHSIINYQSEQGPNIFQQQFVAANQNQGNEMHEHENKSDQGSQQMSEFAQNQLAQVRSLDGQNAHQQQIEMQDLKQSERYEKTIHQAQQEQEVKLPEPISFEKRESSHVIEQLNKLKEESPRQQQITEQHVTFRPNIIQQPQQQTETVHVHQQYQQISTSQQRGRNINIVYQQGSQIQTNSSVDRQRISQSQFQSPSGSTYVRITQHQRSMVPVSSGPGVYVPQGMNIQPVRQSGASFSNQPRPVSGSYQNQPHNLRY